MLFRTPTLDPHSTHTRPTLNPHSNTGTETGLQLPNTPYTSDLLDAHKFEAASVAGLAGFGFSEATHGFPVEGQWVCEAHVQEVSSAIGFPPSDVVQYWSGQGWIKSTMY